MAFNSYSNNKDANKPFEPNVYSGYRWNNAESAVDKTCMTTGYWKQMLKIGIFPVKDTNSDNVTFDMDNGIMVYLNHAKAKMFADELRNFLRDPITYNGVGVPSGSGIITISNGKEFGVNNPIFVIRKLDEVGKVVSSFAYEVKSDYYFSIRNYTGEKNFSKETESYKNLEIEEMIMVLDEYCKAMTYGTAYSIMDANKYNYDRLLGRANAIAEKLGVETNRTSSRGSSFNSSTSFFNSAGSTSNDGYSTATIDDID